MSKKLRLQHRNADKSLKIYGCVALAITVAALWYFFTWKSNVVYVKSSSKVDLNIVDYEMDALEAGSKAEDAFDGEKIVHIDLKGAPPKVSYFKSLFPLLAELGVTGLLMEYEDMFPYKGALLRNISALNAYTLEEIKTINKLAKESHLFVIPLVQTFGHMEFVLKLEEFQHLREVPELPQAICPTNNKTLVLIMAMVDQIVAAHPDSKMIHIGADEVYIIGACDKCSATMLKFDWSKSQLFLEHVGLVARKIHTKHPSLRILMWDDMFRSMSANELRKSHISKFVEPVVWKYSKDVYDDLGPSLWDMYEEIFPKVWIASAFKGATGSNQFLTDTAHHVQNHRSWMSVVNEYKHRIAFQGILITGWQRYDHFAILCELLPAGLPSLAMSLRILLGYNDSPLSPPMEIAKKLQCEQPYALMGPAFGSPHCYYPGGDILEGVLRLQLLKQDYESLLDDSRVRGWMNEYNIAHCFSNPHHLQSISLTINRIKSELSQIKVDMISSLSEVYDNHTVNEWMETYIQPYEDKIHALWKADGQLLSKTHWPRRPLLSINADDCRLEND